MKVLVQKLHACFQYKNLIPFHLASFTTMIKNKIQKNSYLSYLQSPFNIFFHCFSIAFQLVLEWF